MNHLMYTYPKRGVVFMDGITMGGGVGIACPCKYRIATERTVFAMPETSIGLFPDVGGGRYLSRLRGRIAQFLALTGARLDGAECVALGLATHYIPSDRLEEVKRRADRGARACRGDPARRRASSRRRRGSSDNYARHRPLLRLGPARGHPRRAARRTARIGRRRSWRRSRTKSPTACKVSLRLLVESPRQFHFLDEMRLEYGIVVRMFRHPDFIEGVRALLIDKDNAPRWSPPTPEEVTDEMIDRIFEPLPPEEAWTPLGADA